MRIACESARIRANPSREFCECFPNCTDDGLYWQALLADADATTFESTELEGDSEGEPAA